MATKIGGAMSILRGLPAIAICFYRTGISLSAFWIWAETMRNTIIQDADLKKQAFDISEFKKGPECIAVDPLSDVRDAKVLMLEAGIAGNKGSRRVYEESDLDLYTQMRKELNPDRVPMSILEISYVKIRLQLDPKKYGRKQCQTALPDNNSLTEMSGMSRNSFIRLFKQQTGEYQQKADRICLQIASLQ